MNDPKPAHISRLLIVDDNRAIHEDFKKILTPATAQCRILDDVEAALFGEDLAEVSPTGNHFQMESAFQGVEALALVQSSLIQGRPYAMAFMDVRMPPGLDGIETTIKLWEIDPDLQIVICTAYTDYSWEEMVRKLGQSDRMVVLKKPFDTVEVLQLTHSLTRKWQLLQESKTRTSDLENMVLARTAQLTLEQERFKAIFDNSPEGILQTTPDGRFLSANPALAMILGYSSPQEFMALAVNMDEQLYVNPSRAVEFKCRMKNEASVQNFEAEMRCKDGCHKWISLTACKVTKSDGSELYQGFVVDVTAQKFARQERDLMEVHLRHAQKLESVGQLAAGIAHEINTPVQYIGDNIRFVKEAFVDLSELIQNQKRLLAAIPPDAYPPEMKAAIESLNAKTDIDYFIAEVPGAIEQSLEGVRHVAKIVCAMKEFSHPGNAEKVLLDLHHAIETTLMVARNEWKYVADVVTNFAPDLPLVPCLPGEFNQVILNLVVNGAHAISDVIKNQPGAKGLITISTKRADAWVEIRISDTGGGIPEAIRHRIFEPFFTTKEVGKGTGQGLAIARATVVNKHGGELGFDSKIGAGTTFLIRLPMELVPTPKT